MSKWLKYTFFFVLRAKVTLYVDLKNMTLEELREEVFIKHFKMVEPEVTIASSGSIIISGCEDELDERFYSNKLCVMFYLFS